ncbi:hypothetical protein F750_2893 [Streptomyces sp. PAMC 26508]|nr:hypothetical protein F750_2893 [Streptomyces sp. PAMC 26508]
MLDGALQRFAQQIGGVVIELTHRCHDFASALGPDVDL